MGIFPVDRFSGRQSGYPRFSQGKLLFFPPASRDRRQKFFRDRFKLQPGRGFFHRYGRAASAWENAFMKPVELSQDPFYPVADNGHSGPLSDRNPYFSSGPSREIAVNVEMHGGGALPHSHHFPELPVGSQPLFRRKPKILRRRVLPDRQAHFLPLTVTERRLRPFARRRERIALPAEVDIRLRNPWVRFRLML